LKWLKLKGLCIWCWSMPVEVSSCHFS